MTIEIVVGIAAAVTAVGLIFSTIAFIRSGRSAPAGTILTQEELLRFLRTETGQVTELMQDHDRNLRKELGEHLARVQRGIGEVQTLAAGVGDLKKIFANVRARGSFGEGQLETLLEQFLSPKQYIKNAQIKENSQERVEFAIRMPGRDGNEVLLPVDAKFPTEDYERLIAAEEAGDITGKAEAGKALENRVRLCARTIKEKYIYPPRTIEFGILFLPTESLYAEVLRRPGLSESIQREFHVTLSGPTTFAALLNALHMGFRSLALEKRSSEVWQILGAVHTEFEKYNDVVDKLSKQLSTTATSVEALRTRTRAMNRKLFDVEKLPDDAASLLLGPEFQKAEMEEKSPQPIDEKLV